MEYVETKMNCSLVERTHRNSTTRQLCKSEKDLQNYFHIMMSIYQKENEYTNTEAFRHCSKAKISFTIVITCSLAIESLIESSLKSGPQVQF